MLIVSILMALFSVIAPTATLAAARFATMPTNVNLTWLFVRNFQHVKIQRGATYASVSKAFPKLVRITVQILTNARLFHATKTLIAKI